MSNATVSSAAVSKAMNHSTGLSALEEQSLSGLKGQDYDRAKAQLMLSKQQETTAFVSNILKKLNEIAMQVIGNMR